MTPLHALSAFAIAFVLMVPVVANRRGLLSSKISVPGLTTELVVDFRDPSDDDDEKGAGS